MYVLGFWNKTWISKGIVFVENQIRSKVIKSLVLRLILMLMGQDLLQPRWVKETNDNLFMLDSRQIAGWQIVGASVGQYIHLAVEEWNGMELSLFNDDTCPSGHISCPTHVSDILCNSFIIFHYVVIWILWLWKSTWNGFMGIVSTSTCHGTPCTKLVWQTKSSMTIQITNGCQLSCLHGMICTTSLTGGLGSKGI